MGDVVSPQSLDAAVVAFMVLLSLRLVIGEVPGRRARRLGLVIGFALFPLGMAFALRLGPIFLSMIH